MPTTTRGVFFMAQRQAVPMAAGAGDDFVLTLHLRDNQGAHCVEPYLLTWSGAAAAEWWRAHQGKLSAGTPLEVVLHNPRSMPGARAPYIAARVHECRLAPLAPSWSSTKPAAEPASIVKGV